MHPGREKLSDVNFFLPQRRSHALRDKKRAPGRPLRGTRMECIVRGPFGPQHRIGKWWNTRMAVRRFSAAEDRRTASLRNQARPRRVVALQSRKLVVAIRPATRGRYQAAVESRLSPTDQQRKLRGVRSVRHFHSHYPRRTARRSGNLRYAAAMFTHTWTCGEPRKYQTMFGPSICHTSHTPSLPMSPAL